jgi:hypothetical protein
VLKTQSPRFRTALNSAMNGMFMFESVAGNISKLEAKIGGIMLAMLTFSGR